MFLQRLTGISRSFIRIFRHIDETFPHWYNTDMKDFFIQLGLHDKEASVLSSLLELGSSTVSEIAIKARLNRTTTYDILAHLKTMGLVSSVGEAKQITYIAERPDALLNYLEQKSQDYQNKAEEVKRAMPELRALFNEKGNQPKIKFYNGISGIESIYEDTLTATEPIRAYASVRNMHMALPHYFPDYYKRRTTKGIHIRAILPDTEEGKERSEHDKIEARESRLVPVDKFDFSLEIDIYDDKVAIMSLAEEFGVVIQSKRIAEAQKKIFELAWEATEKYN